MRRVPLICALAVLGAPTAAAAEPASVKLAACVPALAATERSATFEARMRRVDGSERMQARFALEVSEGTLPGWRRVVADGLGEWVTSYPGVRRYSYSKTVRNLSAPASYRTVVRFRWLDPDGEVVKRSRETSRACHQPDMRPDLVVTGIEAVGGGYEVALRNRGRTAAGPFSLAFALGAHELDPVELDGLGAGEARSVALAGPACRPGELLTATVDAAGAVDERDEDGNALAAACLP